MKKLLFAFALAAASLGTATAQTASVAAVSPTAAQVAPAASAAAAPVGYVESLTETMRAIYNTGDAAELRELAGTCERAASVNPTDWLPRYYQAYALLINTFQSKDSDDIKDKTLDQAEAALAQARRLKGDESELLALQAYIYQGRFSVSPMTRMMKYPRLVDETAAQAKQANPANPRPYLIAANNLYYRPSMFGGGPDAARPLFEEAKAKFAAYHPANALLPNWGENQVAGRLKKYAATAVK